MCVYCLDEMARLEETARKVAEEAKQDKPTKLQFVRYVSIILSVHVFECVYERLSVCLSVCLSVYLGLINIYKQVLILKFVSQKGKQMLACNLSHFCCCSK